MSIGIKPLMSEEEIVKTRLIAQGIMVPSDYKYADYERPHMHPEAVKALRQKLIDNGILKPNMNRTSRPTTLARPTYKKI